MIGTRCVEHYAANKYGGEVATDNFVHGCRGVCYVRVSMFAVRVAPAQERLRTRRTHSAHKDTKNNAYLQTFLKKNYLENAFFAKRLARDKKN